MRNPFAHYVNELITSYKGVYAETTIDALQRRLNQQDKTLHLLKEEGKVSTVDPSKITLEDVKSFYLTLKERNLSNGTISHELGALHMICMFVNGNTAVQRFKFRFPQARAKKRKGRLPGLTPSIKETVLKNAMSVRIGDFTKLKAYALVVLSFSSGSRVIELRNAKRTSLDLERFTLYLDVVKGGDLYGEPRECPVLPDAIPFLKRYVAERDNHLKELRPPSDILFPGPYGDVMCGQSLRRLKKTVEEECGITLDYRMCRRDYAQTLINMGVPYDAVALVMGHTNTSMTENNYGRKCLEDALQEVSEAVSFKRGLKN